MTMNTLPLFFFGLTVLAQQDPQDPGVAGPALEVVHRYYDQWPTGEDVSHTSQA